MLILVMYPILMLSVKGSLSGFFIILFLLSVVVLLRKDQSTSLMPDNNLLFYSIAMSSVLIATMASQLYHSRFDFSNWDSPSRFICAIPIYLALKRRSINVIEPLQFGLPVGAIMSLILALTIKDHQAGTFYLRASNTFLNPIHFGNFALILGILSACSINWIKSDSRYLLALKLIGFIAGLCASIMSGTRGGWIAIPIILLGWLFIFKRYNKKILAGSFIAASSFILLSYIAFPQIQLRFAESKSEILMIQKGHFNNSAGQRLEIWKGATRIFLANPIFGISPEGFNKAILELGDSGYISRAAAEQGAGEVHSQLFSSAARLGMLGIMSYLLIHIVPLMLFMKSMKSVNQVKRKTALMGGALVVSFIIFSLTVEMYNLKMVATFYSLTVAVLLASCQSKNHA